MKKVGLMVIGLCLAALSQWTVADPIGPNCGTCQGSIYTLSYGGSPLPDADPLHETFRIMLTINTSGYNGGPLLTTFLDSAAIKVSSSVFAASLFSAPGGLANWALIPGGISSGGCDGSGGGFECASYIGPGAGVALGGTLSWVFDITVDNGLLNTALSGSTIKARYVNSSDSKVGDLVSEEITLQRGTVQAVPEPQSLALLGLGLFGLALFGRKRNA
jgi:hypothetical protein